MKVHARARYIRQSPLKVRRSADLEDAVRCRLRLRDLRQVGPRVTQTVSADLAWVR